MEDGTSHGGDKYIELGITDEEGISWAVMLAFQEQPVTEGKRYQISGWFRDADADGVASLVENGGKIDYEWRDAAPTAAGRGSDFLRVSHSFDLTEEWTYQSSIEVAPPGCQGAHSSSRNYLGRYKRRYRRRFICRDYAGAGSESGRRCHRDFF